MHLFSTSPSSRESKLNMLWKFRLISRVAFCSKCNFVLPILFPNRCNAIIIPKRQLKVNFLSILNFYFRVISKGLKIDQTNFMTECLREQQLSSTFFVSPNFSKKFMFFSCHISSIERLTRSCHPEVFCEKVALKNFSKFAVKPLYKSLSL